VEKQTARKIRKYIVSETHFPDLPAQIWADTIFHQRESMSHAIASF